jgi:mannose-6-phosphate isomerase-like protein (cupin superfamily)
MTSSFKVVKKGDATVRRIANNKRAYNFITKEISPKVSLARIEAEKFEGEIVIEQDFIYYVLEGQLTLKFGDNVVVLNPNDSCFVPKNSTYKMSGTFKTIVVSQPACGT